MTLRARWLLPFAALAALCSAACAGCGPQPVGATCDPAAEEACADDAVCEPDGDAHTCRIPLGGGCNPEADEPHCTSAGECFAVNDEGEGECLVPRAGTCEGNESHCAAGLVCAEREGDAPAECHPPVFFEGHVRDATDDSPIGGALVIAFDGESAPISDVAETNADGEYRLEVFAVRDADGRPAGDAFTLAASAQDYQRFPGGVRAALPIDGALATEEDRGFVVSGPLTEIVLVPLPEAERGRASISGTVEAGALSDGVLVVAESGGVGYSAVSDRRGAYKIFNVPDGSHTVSGYRADVQLDSVAVDVDGADLVDVNLGATSDATHTVTGKIRGVDGVGSRPTTIVLVVESTFQETTERGEVPLGLRAPRTGPADVNGDWTISGVPDGRYKVLAAFENDELVRDPDDSIGGTALVSINVTGDTEAGSFNVTRALAVVSPGADEPEAVTDPPTLRWQDDSSEDSYDVVVLSSYGDIVWETNVPGVSGDEATVTYGGPALETGLFYQFRVTSRAGNGSALSRTEDLRGVFFVE